MKTTLVAAALFAAVCHPAMAAEGQPAPIFHVATKRADDKVDLHVEKGRAVLSLRSPFGIGQAVIRREGPKWPDAVVLRLHLKGLESFQAAGGKVALDAAVSMQGGKVKVRLWRDGEENAPLNENSPLWTDIRLLTGDGQAARDLPLKDGYFEIALPRALFADSPRSITLSWIDFYR